MGGVIAAPVVGKIIEDTLSYMQLERRYTEDAMKSMAFVFSSRRRHTRSLRDWSSDVCSSDLGQRRGFCGGDPRSAGASAGWPRSEERRVGKECRSRWSPYQSKKKMARYMI